MAFLGKNYKPTQRFQGNAPVLNQRIHTECVRTTLPQSTTNQIFRIAGGDILVHNLFGKVTTVIEGTDPVLKLSSKALDSAGAAVGTAVDFASTVDLSSLEVGGFVYAEGDGTALVKSNAGVAYVGANGGSFILPQGEVYVTTGASKTGAITWYMEWQPITPGAYVYVPASATAI